MLSDLLEEEIGEEVEILEGGRRKAHTTVLFLLSLQRTSPSHKNKTRNPEVATAKQNLIEIYLGKARLPE